MGLVFSSINPTEYEALTHYGVGKRDGAKIGSGRYPLGSGENPYQHDGGTFAGAVRDLKKKGLTETEIAAQYEMSTTQLRARYSMSASAQKAEQIAKAIEMHDRGMSNVEIGKELGVAPNTIKNYLDPTLSNRLNKTQEIAEILKKEVEKKPYLDVGKGVEYQLDCTRTKLDTAIEMLKDEGYKLQYVSVSQANNPDQKTNVKVLTKDDVPYNELYSNRDKITSVLDTYSNDGGRSFRGVVEPRSIDSKRIAINYAETGGAEKDGVIEIRPGVPELSLGANRYAQVRIAVDGTHYLKGMAIYNENLPAGVDIMFNTNKHEGVPKIDKNGGDSVLKSMKLDKDNPFGSTVRQQNYIGPDGKEHLSAINIVNEDEDWGKWSKTISSQMLSKQRPEVAKKQLDLTYETKRAEFEDIKSITNPVVRNKLLYSFAEDCDASAVHLKATGFSRQASHVILPVKSLKDNEVYAPNYENGEEVILIRHPHAGAFETPVLRVNNKNKEAISIMGRAEHAIGINTNVAQQLSGADFDGDTVIVIPTRNQKLRSVRDIAPGSELLTLKNFNPSESYPAYEGMPKTGPKTGFHKQTEMGKVSNLITDMTIMGATDKEIARAVRHSMVVIDAEKHNLNWRQSEKDNGIKELKAKYQGGSNAGSATLISRAKSDARPGERENKYHVKNAYDIDPNTGEKIFTYTGRTYTNRSGKEVKATTRSTKMYEARDAFELTSGPKGTEGKPIEKVYATYANQMKALGNAARKEYMKASPRVYDPQAKETYRAEVDSLNAKLNIAKKHAPQERKAQLVTSKIMEAKYKENPELKEDYEQKKKVTAQVLSEQRRRASGTSDRKTWRIDITPEEWRAIDAGAISSTKLGEILNNTDMDVVQKYATPRTSVGITPAQLSLARSMLSNERYTQAEVADRLGVSVSTLMKAVK